MDKRNSKRLWAVAILFVPIVVVAAGRLVRWDDTDGFLIGSLVIIVVCLVLLLVTALHQRKKE